MRRLMTMLTIVALAITTTFTSVQAHSFAAAVYQLKKDGTPDKRYNANKHLKKDGTMDMRYSTSKKAAAKTTAKTERKTVKKS